MADPNFETIVLDSDEEERQALNRNAANESEIQTIELEVEVVGGGSNRESDSDLEIIDVIPYKSGSSNKVSELLSKNLKLVDACSTEAAGEPQSNCQAIVYSNTSYDSDGKILDLKSNAESGDDQPPSSCRYGDLDVEYVQTGSSRRYASDRYKAASSSTALTARPTTSTADQSTADSKRSVQGSAKSWSKDQPSSYMKVPNEFCYMCGRWMNERQLLKANKITKYKREYEDYFKMEPAISSFTPSLICESCTKHLTKYKNGLLDRKTYQIPCIWPLGPSSNPVGVGPVRYHYNWTIVDKKTGQPVQLTYAEYLYRLIKKI